MNIFIPYYNDGKTKINKTIKIKTQRKRVNFPNKSKSIMTIIDIINVKQKIG